MESKSSWFDGSWFSDSNSEPKLPMTTTTARPLTPAPSNWFQTLIASEDLDGAYQTNEITVSK